MPVTSGAYEGKGGKYQRNFVSESGDLTQIKATEHIAANTSGPIHVRFLSGKRMALKQKVGYTVAVYLKSSQSRLCLTSYVCTSSVES